MKTLKELFLYIQSDCQRYTDKTGGVFSIVKYLIVSRNHCFRYSFWLRLSSRKNILYPLAKLMHYRLGRKYNIQIPSSTKIGYGLYLGHGICMVVNGKTIIGNNVNLSQFLNIGSNVGTPAVIGDNVYIGPSVCLVENVHIGNNATIGAGAVVTRDIPENATAVGVPAKVISYENPGQYVCRRFTGFPKVHICQETIQTADCKDNITEV